MSPLVVEGFLLSSQNVRIFAHGFPPCVCGFIGEGGLPPRVDVTGLSRVGIIVL